MGRLAIALSLLGLAWLPLASPARAATVSCANGTASGDLCTCVNGQPSCAGRAARFGDSPGATLLLPYFEVDLGNPNGVTTLVWINNASANAVIAHVILWTDLAVPVLEFNLYLTGYDQQFLNLADLLVRGIPPQTAAAGQDPADLISPRGPFSQDADFASCAELLPLPNLSGTFLSHLQTSLTGAFSNVLGGCGAVAYGDNIARGYLTADTVAGCTLRLPGDVGYFAADGTGDVTDQNVLWGDYYYVNSATNRADGDTLVALAANAGDPATSSPGQYTFYGRYVGWSAADHREPLATNFGARFAIGSANTYYVVWRDAKVQQAPFHCGTLPAWYPLGQEQVVVFDEQEHPQVPQSYPVSPSPAGTIVPFPAATQKTQVGSSALPVPYSFGWTYLDLNTTVTAAGNVPPADGAAAQAWVEVLMDSQGRFYSGHDAVQLDSAGKASHVILGSPP